MGQSAEEIFTFHSSRSNGVRRSDHRGRPSGPEQFPGRSQLHRGVCSVPGATPAAAPAKAAAPADDDDEVDLFADSDEEDDEEAAKIKEARVAAYKEKKSQKAAVIAKSSIVLDVKPWDDETVKQIFFFGLNLCQEILLTSW